MLKISSSHMEHTTPITNFGDKFMMANSVQFKILRHGKNYLFRRVTLWKVQWIMLADVQNYHQYFYWWHLFCYFLTDGFCVLGARELLWINMHELSWHPHYESLAITNLSVFDRNMKRLQLKIKESKIWEEGLKLLCVKAN